jgi:hypothetical protein
MIPIYGQSAKRLAVTFFTDATPILNNRLEQDHRGIRTAILPHAWVWECGLSGPFLSRRC